jgi:hypothetical protein
MRRRVKSLLALAAWALIVSVGYIVLSMVVVEVAEALAIAFVAFLLVPLAIVETREVLRDD